jgi:protein-disulfide isomerase
MEEQNEPARNASRSEAGGEKMNEDLSMNSEGEKELSIKDCKKKIKNYTSIIILLVGLLVGSIFVDVAQFFGQQGVSPRVLKSIDVFPLDGKTWVAYNEPVVNVQILTDSKCEACDPTEPLKWLKRVIPTMLAKKVEVDSPEGERLIADFKVKSIPAFVFDENITKTDVYEQAQAIFKKVNSSYLMDTNQVGIKPGKILETPKTEDTDAQMGPRDAKVKVVLFSDFQCPYCKMFHDTFRKAMAEYKDRVLFVYKYDPLQIHPQAANAALAAACAGDQGKFWEIADKLYASQDDWGKSQGLTKFKTYAISLGLKANDFNSCVDSGKFKDKIDADTKEAEDFGITGTPAFFVNDQFFGGVVQLEEFKKTLDEELAK